MEDEAREPEERRASLWWEGSPRPSPVPLDEPTPNQNSRWVNLAIIHSLLVYQ